MADRTAKEQAIAENYESFEAMLELLLREHPGEYALMRDREVVNFYPSASTAQLAGLQKYPDGLFSVQKIEEKAIDLGFYSHARYRRVA